MAFFEARFIGAIFLFAGLTAAGEEPRDRPTGTTVSGRVMSEPGGKGVAGAVVVLWNGSGGGQRTARTDEQGSYSFSAVAPGDHYRLWIERSDRETGIWSEDVDIRVKDRPVRADDLFRTLPQSISGRVTDVDTGAPVPGAIINFSTRSNRAFVVTDKEGSYRLFVTRRVVAIRCNGTDSRYYPATQEHIWTGAAPGSTSNVDFQIKSPPEFTGEVVFPDGRPAKDLEVLVQMRWSGNPQGAGGGMVFGSGWDRRFKTDESGRFVGFLKRPDRPDLKETITAKAMARVADATMGGVSQIDFPSDQLPAHPLRVVLARTAGLKVRVVNPEGKHVTDAQLTAAEGWHGLHTELGGPVKHLGDGTYEMTGLIPGLDYYLAVRAEGFELNASSKGFVLKPDEVRHLGIIRMERWGRPAVPGLPFPTSSAP